MELEKQIEAILFYKGEPVGKKWLANSLSKNIDEIGDAIKKLSLSLSGRGINLIENSEEVMLGTAPGASSVIEKISKEELSKDIGKAGLETLSIILYRGPIARKEIEYIRGVNSSYILRNLLIRGLIEKTSEAGKSYAYSPTIELLRYLGISRKEEAPQFEKMKAEVMQFENAEKDKEADHERDSLEQI